MKFSHTSFLRKLFLFALVLMLPFAYADAQTKKQLEANKKKIENEIKSLNNQLSTTKNDKNASQKQINLLQAKIKEREKLIGNINSQMKVLDEQITVTKNNINVLVCQIDSLKSEYAKVIRMLYRQRSSLSEMVLIFNAKNFNQAYQRQKYFKNYSRHRMLKAEEILTKEQELESVSEKLKTQKEEQISLLKQEEQQRKKLASEREDNKKKLSSLEKKEKNLAAELKKKEKQAQELQKKIQKIIQDEIRKAEEAARKKREAEGKKTTTDNKTQILATPEEIALSNSFAENKSKLPWPVEKGTVSKKFGENVHSSGAKFMNNGLDIITNANEAVRSVFNGVVTKIFTAPNGCMVIIIQHGEYRSVYTNLKSVSVSEGAKVTTKQRIGVVATSSVDNKTEMNFQIWKTYDVQNPQLWLAPRK